MTSSLPGINSPALGESEFFTNQPPGGARAPFPKTWSWRDAVSLVLAAAVLILFRRHAFDLPLETDECNYIYIGKRLLAGDRLYVDAWDHQPFGVFALFAGVIALFGDAPIVFRWMATGFSAASLFLLYAIIRRCGGMAAAIAGGVLFALASADPGTAGEGCNREIVMNTMILAAWFFVLRADGRGSWEVAVAGLFLALGSSLKIILAVHWLFLGVWIALSADHAAASRSRPRQLWKTLGLFSAGPLFAWTSASAYYAATGRFFEFLDAVFFFNVSYSERTETFLARFWRFFTPEKHPFVFDSAMPLWIGAIGACLWLLYESIARRNRIALLSLMMVLAGYAAVCLPAHSWPHYYYLLIPPLVIAVSVAPTRFASCLGASSRWTPNFIRGGAFALYLIVGSGLLWTEYRDYLGQPPFGITVKRYNSRDFWGRAIGEKVGAVTNPGDSIFVYGNEAEIYYYAGRRCASRYTMITGLKKGYDHAEQRQRLLLADLHRDRPRVIIVLFDVEPYAEWSRFLEDHYGVAVGWDCHDRYTDRCANPQPRYVTMLVYVDKDRPVESMDWSWDRSAVGGWFLSGPH